MHVNAYKIMDRSPRTVTYVGTVDVALGLHPR